MGDAGRPGPGRGVSGGEVDRPAARNASAAMTSKDKAGEMGLAPAVDDAADGTAMPSQDER